MKIISSKVLRHIQGKRIDYFEVEVLCQTGWFSPKTVVYKAIGDRGYQDWRDYITGEQMPSKVVHACNIAAAKWLADIIENEDPQRTAAK